MKRIGLSLKIAGLLLVGTAWGWFGSEASRAEHNSKTGREQTAPYSLSYQKKSKAAPERYKADAAAGKADTTGPQQNKVGYYYGLCDASAAVALDGETFVVGDDEDNVLRVYKRATGGQPVFSLDLSRFLRVDPKAPEVDIEGADRVGDRIYWISSHGRNLKGKDAPSRQRFFATTVVVSNGIISLKPVGRPYCNLLADMLLEPRLRPFNLALAAAFPPKSPGALNIEGLSATPQGHLLIAFRNPIPQGRALLLPLLNPHEVIEGWPARLGDPILLELQGRGIRSITLWLGHYFIVAGSSDHGGHSRFFVWDGVNAPQPLKGLEPGGLNPEAVAFWDELGTERLYIVSDDGTEPLLGTECKKVKNSAWKRFRAVCLNPSADVAQAP